MGTASTKPFNGRKGKLELVSLVRGNTEEDDQSAELASAAQVVQGSTSKASEPGESTAPVPAAPVAAAPPPAPPSPAPVPKPKPARTKAPVVPAAKPIPLARRRG